LKRAIALVLSFGTSRDRIARAASAGSSTQRG
jgi:hypothetical protein